MPYRGRRGKSRGCFALDKEGIPQCNRKKRNKKKRKTAYREKRKFVREKEKGVKKVKGKKKGEEERNDRKRADGRVV